MQLDGPALHRVGCAAYPQAVPDLVGNSLGATVRELADDVVLQ